MKFNRNSSIRSLLITLSFLYANTVFGNECSDALAQADADNSKNLTKAEFINFLSIYLPNCYDPSAELTDFQNGAFTTLACACIVTSFDLECCNEENAIIGIEKLPDAICVAVSGASLADGCSFDDLPGLPDKGDDSQQDDGVNDFLANIIDSECADLLRSQDLVTNKTLTLAEYGAYLAARFPDCYTSPVATPLQERLFTGLACGYCATNPPNELSCCNDITNENAVVGIEQGLDLAAVCSAAIAGKQLDCMEPPAQDEQIVPQECLDAIIGANGDGNDFLDQTELGSFLKIRYPDCEAYQGGELSDAQNFILRGIACANCVTTPPFNLTCCNDEEYTISIAGANNENRTFLQTANLATICSSVDATASVDGCLPFSGGDGNGDPPGNSETPSPSSAETTAAPTVTPSVLSSTSVPSTLQPTDLREETRPPAGALEQTRAPSNIRADPAGINSPSDAFSSGVAVESTILYIMGIILATMLL